MTNLATNSIINKKEQFFTILANGTTYQITVVIFNNKGEARFIKQNSFQNVVFETIHTSPFLLGNLTIVNDSNIDLLNVNNSGLQTNSYGHGDEFIKIKISYLDSSNKTHVLVDKQFITTHKTNVVQQNQNQTMYYFVDIVYSHFYNKRLSWCTDMVTDQTITNYGHNKVNAGKALKHLLRTFSEDKDIIDESDWDNGIGKLYYTLPSTCPALHGISSILNSYVSSDNSAGILTYYNGKFQLKSLKKHINGIFKKQNINQLTGAFKIQTYDKQVKYTNKQTDLFGRNFEYIPLDITNIQFEDIQPNVTLNNLAKNEIIQFSTEQKKFTIHSNQGTLKQVSETINNNDTTLNIEENKQFNIKEKLFKLSDDNTTAHYGTIRLQKQLLDNLTSASFSTGGNIDFNATKFIYMTIDINLKNKFANKIPGFWYIKSNVTILNKQQFASTIECVKLDKLK